MFMGQADVDIRYVSFHELGRTKIGPLDSTTFDAAGNVTHIGTNQIARYPLHTHYLSGPAQGRSDGYQFSLVGNSVDNGQRRPAVQVGHRHPPQQLRPDPGQRRLQHRRGGVLDRGRLGELQRLPAQLRRPRQRHRRLLRPERQHRLRLLVQGPEQLRPRQRGGQRVRGNLQLRLRRLRHLHRRPAGPEVPRGEPLDPRSIRQRQYERHAPAGVRPQRGVRGDPDRAVPVVDRHRRRHARRRGRERRQGLPRLELPFSGIHNWPTNHVTYDGYVAAGNGTRPTAWTSWTTTRRAWSSRTPTFRGCGRGSSLVPGRGHDGDPGFLPPEPYVTSPSRRCRR